MAERSDNYARPCLKSDRFYAIIRTTIEKESDLCLQT